MKLNREFFLIAMLSFLMLSLSLVNAQSFSVHVQPINKTIRQNGIASFKITIINGPEYNHIRLVPINDPSKWSFVHTTPDYIYLSGLNLQPNETVSFNLFVKTQYSPSSQIEPGSYAIALKLKSDSGFVVQKLLPIDVLPFTPTLEDYTTYISMNADLPNVIDPREMNYLTVSFTNKANFPLLALKLKINSSIFSTSKIISLDANGRNQFKFLINLSPRIKPQSGLLSVKLFTPSNQLITQLDVPYRILNYSQFKQESSVKRGFLKRSITLRIRNMGNAPGKAEVKYPVRLFASWFTSADGASYKFIDGKRYLVWTFDLKPNEQRVVSVNENFTPLFIVILLALLGYVFYYFFIRNPIVVKKEAHIIKLKEGGISELKVFIHIKNRSAKVFENVVLLDKLPKIAEIDKTIKAGTLKPSKIIRHSVKGTVIKWEIGTLDKFEERIINYTIKSKLSILGWFKLPSAAVKFKHKNTTFVTKSNSVRLEVPKPEEK